MIEIGVVVSDYTVRQIMLGNCWWLYKPCSKYEKPICMPGDIMYIREAWQGVPVNDEGDWESVIYRADNNDEVQNWTSGRWMPIHLSRAKMVVARARQARLHNVKKQEYDQPGIRYDLIDPDWRDLQFKMNWDRLHIRWGISYESNPLVWVYEWDEIVRYGDEHILRKESKRWHTWDQEQKIP